MKKIYCAQHIADEASRGKARIKNAVKGNRVIATLKTVAKVVATVSFHLIGFAFVGMPAG